MEHNKELQDSNYTIDSITLEKKIELDEIAIRALVVLNDERIAIMKSDTSIHIYDPSRILN